MDKTLLEMVQEIIYYYNEYQKGNIDDTALKIVLKSIKKSHSKNMNFYYIMKIIEPYMKTTTTILYNKLLESKDYQTLIADYQNDLTLYLEAITTINKYTKKAIKEKQYSNLDDIYILNFFKNEILKNLLTYIKNINELKAYLNEGLPLMPTIRVEDERNKINQPIKQTLVKIKKENNLP